MPIPASSPRRLSTLIFLLLLLLLPVLVIVRYSDAPLSFRLHTALGSCFLSAALYGVSAGTARRRSSSSSSSTTAVSLLRFHRLASYIGAVVGSFAVISILYRKSNMGKGVLLLDRYATSWHGAAGATALFLFLSLLLATSGGSGRLLPRSLRVYPGRFAHVATGALTVGCLVTAVVSGAYKTGGTEIVACATVVGVWVLVGVAGRARGG